MRRTVLFIGGGLFLVWIIAGIFTASHIRHPDSNRSATYREYAFDTGKDQDLGFTKRALQELHVKEPLLSTGNAIVEFPNLKILNQTNEDYARGVVYQLQWEEERYELYQNRNHLNPKGIYQMRKNGQPLFEAQMDMGAEGPIVDARMIEGKPAFTFLSSCNTDAQNTVYCDTDVWYDGNFMSQQFNVNSPEFLLVYKGKKGFIAKDNRQERFFFNGSFVTPSFDTIWSHNCCSYTEILPTLHNNGTVMFYAKRQGQNYLVETILSPS